MTFCEKWAHSGERYPIADPMGLPLAFGLTVSQMLTFLGLLLYFIYARRRGRRSFAEDLPEREAILLLPAYGRLFGVLVLYQLVTLVVLSTVSNSWAPPTVTTQDISSSVVQGFVWGFSHFMFESITFFLAQQGSGTAAASRALLYGAAFGVFTWVMITLCFHYGRHEDDVGFGNVLFLCWNGVSAVMYAVLWLCPARFLFRRPALYWYAAFFFLVRSLSLVGELFRILDSSDVHICISIVPEWILLSPAVPLVVYYALLTDSKYWHGDYEMLSSESASSKLDPEDIRSPLAGRNPYTASMVGRVSDAIEHMQRSGVRLINFASLTLPEPKVLGVGGTATVYKGQWRAEPVAVKMIFCKKLTQTEVQSFTREADMLQRLKHPHVVQVIGVCIAPPALCLVLELCEKNLHQALQATLAFDTRIHFAVQCARATHFLHTRRPAIVHKDIKGANFLLSHKGVVKLADFGVSEVNRAVGEVRFHAWTPEWAAPELFAASPASPQTDVYALTLTVWECLTSQEPFTPRDAQSDLKAAILAGQRPTIPGGCPDKLQRLLQGGWEADPAKRLTALHFVHVLPTFMSTARRSYPLSIQQVMGSTSQVAAENYVTFLLDPLAGLVQDRMYHMRPYEACLVGAEMVTYMVSHPELFSVKTREEASRLGQAMVAYGLMRHVCGDHDFKDDYLFFMPCATGE